MDTHVARGALLVLTLGAAGAALLPALASAQAPVPVKVTVTVNGRTETLRGNGRCAHEPHASIYGTAAALWTAEFEGDGGRRVRLTHWRPQGDGMEEQFSFSVQSGPKGHRISTVKGGKPEGSGRSTFRPTAQGGRFEITGKDQDGMPLKATIECARFTGINAVGG